MVWRAGASLSVLAITHSISIRASPKRVWELTTTNIMSLPEVTPTIERVERLDLGALEPGDRFKLWQPDLVAAVWTVTVVDSKKREFAWKRRIGLTTITAAHHILGAKNGCVNTLSIELSGPGSRVVERAMRKRASAALIAENEGFKAAAESPR